MSAFRFKTSRTVPEGITGDYYEDWKKTIGDEPDTVNAIGHKTVMLIETKPQFFAYLKDDDIFEGELFEFIPYYMKYYVSSSVFTELAVKTVDAFYALDVNGDEQAFSDALSELQYLVEETLKRMKHVSEDVTVTISGDSVNRIITLEIIVSPPSDWGEQSWSEFGWGL